MAPFLSKKLLNLQRKRFAQGKRRERTNNVPPEERRARAILSAAKQKAVKDDIKLVWADLNVKTVNLAEKHGISVPEMRRRIQHLPKYGPRRAVNVYNAVLHVRNLEINEELPDNEKLKLSDLQALAKMEDWRSLPQEKLDEMAAMLEAKRDLENKGIRSRPTAVTRDVQAVTRRVQQELRDLATRTGVGYCFFVARSRTKDTVKPVVGMDQRSKDFFEVVLKSQVDDLILKFESFHVLGLEGMARNDNERKNLIRSYVRTRITQGLCEATGDPTALMEWKDYDNLIVCRRGASLDGWPFERFGVESLGLRDLKILKQMWDEGELVWRMLTPEEINQRKRALQEKRVNGEGKQRKERSDKGQKRPPYKNSASKKKHSSNKENDAPPRAKRSKTSKTQRPTTRKRARSIISSSESEQEFSVHEDSEISDINEPNEEEEEQADDEV